MSRCNVTREWLVTETTRATLLLEEILTKSKEFEGQQFQSYIKSIESSVTALRMIRYFSIPYDPVKPCSKENCCRTWSSGKYDDKERHFVMGVMATKNGYDWYKIEQPKPKPTYWYADDPEFPLGQE